VKVLLNLSHIHIKYLIFLAQNKKQFDQGDFVKNILNYYDGNFNCFKCFQKIFLFSVSYSLRVRFSNKGKGLRLVEWIWGKCLGLDCRRRLLLPEETAKRGDWDWDRQTASRKRICWRGSALGGSAPPAGSFHLCCSVATAPWLLRHRNRRAWFGCWLCSRFMFQQKSLNS